MKYKQPILITGVERSGSTIIARVFEVCGAFTGQTNVMRENKQIRALNRAYVNMNVKGCTMPDLKNINVPTNWKERVDCFLELQGLSKEDSCVLKDAILAQIWPVWHLAYPNAKWIIVRRRTGDILHSCCETAYMKRFKNPVNRKMVGVTSEKAGWIWWVHQYEDRFVEMIGANLNCKIVWPERMRDGDFVQMKEVVEWAGLEWNDAEVKKMAKSLLKTK